MKKQNNQNFQGRTDTRTDQQILEKHTGVQEKVSGYMKRGKLRRIIAILSAFVLLFTLNSLKFRADTLQRIAMCGLEEHTHTEACYNEAGELVCGLTEHEHTDACYQQTPDVGDGLEILDPGIVDRPEAVDLDVALDMELEQPLDLSGVRALCEELDVPYHVVNTEIYKIIFEVRKESNPCSLCAKMRRGALHNAAKELGCNVVALGHHFDDVVDTFMLNLFFEGRIGCFQPVTYLSRRDITLIRPMIYMPEKDVRYFASHASLPVAKSTCPADGNTQRAEMQKLLAGLERTYPGLRYRIFGAIQRGEVDGFHMPLQKRMRGSADYGIASEQNFGAAEQK